MNGADASGTKDPAIKLFGKTIPVPVARIPAKSDGKSDVGFQIPFKSEAMNLCHVVIPKTESMDDHLDKSGPQRNSGKDNDTQLTGDRRGTQTNLKPKEDPAETSSSIEETEKVLKKPDKILVCPRCNSLDTKFCYFNNYNVNQPRHFCKHCHRYWTAGGTVRNVPLGTGRRKNKQLASQYRRESLVFNDLAPVTRVEIPHSTFNSATVLRFAGEGHFHESAGGKRREDTPLCGSSVTASDIVVDENQIPQEVKEQDSQSNPMPYPISPWVLVPAPDDGNDNPTRWSPTPMLAVPPGIPLNFVPASYWSCFPVWSAGAGHSLALGRHSRDGNSMDEEKSEKCVLVPKTLRIEDPDNDSKSSTVTTLGFNSNQEESKLRCGVFRPYKPSPERKGYPLDTTEVLEGNPGALSRAHTFQEST
ncbi:hypothetical protein RHMOL_Rhmol03G0053900 [Rhododendron molle]|uniref:Uncharacterized protein n=1 Tax=Rhododendron molle TaxID=49168 RepID=A0ACC0PC18_RHOML|nr:hypothetical protein RHMOL_Rhmol03G0053900 [Rhododendron molle]